MKKYKVIDAKVNKKLINDEWKLEEIKNKKPKPPVIITETEHGGSDVINLSRPKTARELLLEFMAETRANFTDIRSILKDHGKRIGKLENVLERNNLH